MTLHFIPSRALPPPSGAPPCHSRFHPPPRLHSLTIGLSLQKLLVSGRPSPDGPPRAVTAPDYSSKWHRRRKAPWRSSSLRRYGCEIFVNCERRRNIYSPLFTLMIWFSSAGFYQEVGPGKITARNIFILNIYSIIYIYQPAPFSMSLSRVWRKTIDLNNVVRNCGTLLDRKVLGPWNCEECVFFPATHCSVGMNFPTPQNL